MCIQTRIQNNLILFIANALIAAHLNARVETVCRSVRVHSLHFPPPPPTEARSQSVPLRGQLGVTETCLTKPNIPLCLSVVILSASYVICAPRTTLVYEYVKDMFKLTHTPDMTVWEPLVILDSQQNRLKRERNRRSITSTVDRKGIYK